MHTYCTKAYNRHRVGTEHMRGDTIDRDFVTCTQSEESDDNQQLYHDTTIEENSSEDWVD